MPPITEPLLAFRARDRVPAAPAPFSSTLWNRSRRSRGTESDAAPAGGLTLVLRTEEVMNEAPPAAFPPGGASAFLARFDAESVSGSPGEASSSPSRLRFAALFPKLFRREKPAFIIELNRLLPFPSLRGRGVGGGGGDEEAPSAVTKKRRSRATKTSEAAAGGRARTGLGVVRSSSDAPRRGTLVRVRDRRGPPLRGGGHRGVCARAPGLCRAPAARRIHQMGAMPPPRRARPLENSKSR